MNDDKAIIGFFHEYDAYGCFSNWYPAEFDYAGIHYSNAEQYMMYQKVTMFGRYDLGEQIMNTSDPATCKKIARQKFPEFVPATWDRTCHVIVRRGAKAKFQQNEDLRKVLLDTGNSLLAECSPDDRKWGIGIDINDPACYDVKSWRGDNLLGRTLMEVREELRLDLLLSSEMDDKTDTLDASFPEWEMTIGEVLRIPQFHNTVQTYLATLAGIYPMANMIDVVFSAIDYQMHVNMGGGLPIAGFYEMKEDMRDISKRSRLLRDKAAGGLFAQEG